MKHEKVWKKQGGKGRTGGKTKNRTIAARKKGVWQKTNVSIKKTI